MSNNTAIEWTDATWNPVTGCTKISAGCDNCYAERFAERFRGVPGHPFEPGFDLTLRPARLEQPLSWKSPKMISVKATGCCPIVTAFESGERFAKLHENAHTVASGLRVPAAVGDFIMLDLIRASGGTAIAVTDEEMISCAREIAAKTGVFACPEGGATLAAYRRLIDDGFLKESDQTVLFNTGSGVKYLEALGQ